MPTDPTRDVAAKLHLLHTIVMTVGNEANDEWCESHSWDDVPESKHAAYVDWLRSVDTRFDRLSAELLALLKSRPKG